MFSVGDEAKNRQHHTLSKADYPLLAKVMEGYTWPRLVTVVLGTRAINAPQFFCSFS
jgi:hypothetical protein